PDRLVEGDRRGTLHGSSLTVAEEFAGHRGRTSDDDARDALSEYERGGTDVAPCHHEQVRIEVLGSPDAAVGNPLDVEPARDAESRAVVTRQEINHDRKARGRRQPRRTCNDGRTGRIGTLRCDPAPSVRGAARTHTRIHEAWR